MADCKILIIDDDEDDVEILADAFSECGVDSVQYVNTAMQAFIFLQEAEQHSLPRLIVTDHFLPGITGAEFLKDLKSMVKYSHIPVIVLASVKSDREIERYKEMGVLEYVVKPVSYHDYVRVAAEMKTWAGL